MTEAQFWVLLLAFLSLGLMLVNFFRFNIMFVVAAVFVNVGLAMQPGIPIWLYEAAWILAIGEAAAGIVHLAFGKKNRKRFVG